MEFAISQPKMRKANISIELYASIVTIGFDLGHDLDLEFLRSKEFAIPRAKMVWLPQNEKHTYRLNSRPQKWPMGLTLTMDFHGQILKGDDIEQRGGSRPLMTMTVTIWWPGVRIYQIVTRVTSDVGVPLTHLVVHISYIMKSYHNVTIWSALTNRSAPKKALQFVTK